MKFLNKSNVVQNVAKKTGLNLKDSKMSVETLINVISNSLSKGKDVRLTGFGTFKVSHRKAHKGHNPATGKSMKIAARNVPSFKAGAALKRIVNK